jgi:Na+/glutamate symporter
MNETVWIAITVALVGIIIGGAGGAALFRRAVKLPMSSEEQNQNRIGDNAALASSVAAKTASAFRTELNGHIGNLTEKIDKQNDNLQALTLRITEFMAVCPVKHQMIEQRIEILENK